MDSTTATLARYVTSLRSEDLSPAVIHEPFSAPLKTFSSGLYNYGLTVPIPEIIQRIAGVDVSLHNLNVKVNGTTRSKGKKRGYFEAIGCPGGKRKVTVTFTPETGSPGTANASQACK